MLYPALVQSWMTWSPWRETMAFTVTQHRFALPYVVLVLPLHINDIHILALDVTTEGFPLRLTVVTPGNITEGVCSFTARCQTKGHTVQLLSLLEVSSCASTALGTAHWHWHPLILSVATWAASCDRSSSKWGVTQAGKSQEQRGREEDGHHLGWYLPLEEMKNSQSDCLMVWQDEHISQHGDFPAVCLYGVWNNNPA